MQTIVGILQPAAKPHKAESITLEKSCQQDGDVRGAEQLANSYTNDPDCPVNWPARRKSVVLWSTASVAALVTAFGPMVGTSYNEISVEFAQSTNHVVQMMSGNFSVALGLGTLVTSAFGVVYGRRPAFLISVILLDILSLWMAFGRRFSDLQVSRILQGISAAPLEVLSTGLVADLFVVEERGRGLAIVGALHFISVLLSQVLAGFAVQHLGWRSLFLTMACLLACVWPIVLFLIPETSWVRSKLSGEHDKDNRGHRSLQTVISDASQVRSLNHEQSTQSSSPPNLRLWNGRISDASFWTTCFRPLPLLCYPAVIFGSFVHGLGSTYLSAFAFAKLRLFSAAPYHLTPSQIGLTVLPGAVTGLAAQYIAGTLSDQLIKKLSKRGHGTSEPEYRMLLMIPQCIFSVIGFIGFGTSIAHGQPLWQVLLFYACVTFSVPFGSLASLGYLVDAMPRRNQEGLVSTMLVKSIFLLIFASMINGWLDKYGVQRVFVALGLLNLCISLCTIPFYIYGKLLRTLVADSNILNKLDRAFE